MGTGINQKFRYTYKVSMELKAYTIYDFVHSYPTGNHLPETVRIEAFHGKSEAIKIADYFRIKDARSWEKSSAITGLFVSGTESVFYGKCQKPYLINTYRKTLLIFRFDHEAEKMHVDVYPNFYPSSSFELKQLV